MLQSTSRRFLRELDEAPGGNNLQYIYYSVLAFWFLHSLVTRVCIMKSCWKATGGSPESCVRGPLIESGFDILAKFSMNLWQKFTKPKNACTCLTLVSTGHSRTPESFSSSIYTLFSDIIMPKYLMLLCSKKHFSALAQRSLNQSLFSTFLTNRLCSFKHVPNII